MKKQYILMLTDDEAKNLIAAVDENTAEIITKQSVFYSKKEELDKLTDEIQNLLK